MADFSVEGFAEIKEGLSDSFDKINRSARTLQQQLEDLSDDSSNAAVAFGELAGVGQGFEESMDEAEDSVEELNDEITQAIGNMQLMTTSLAEAGTAGKFFEQSFDEIDAGGFIDHPEFGEALKEELDLDDEQLGSIRGMFRIQEGDTMADLSRQISKRSDVDMDVGEVGEGVRQAATNLTVVQERLDEVGDEADETSRSLFTVGTTAAAQATPLQFLALSLSNVEEQAEDADEDIKRLSASLAGALPALSSLSANIGPFNVGLTNLATTIPLLIATIGPLIGVLGGLAAALVGVTAALGALIAVGAIGFVQQLEEQFASVTETTEALEAMLQGLQQAFWEAVAPLREVEVAGMGGIDLFLRVLQNTVELVNMTSQVLAELLEMEEVAGFFFRVEAALLGIGNAKEGMTMMEAMKESIDDVLPILTDFVLFIIDHTPDFIRFASNITKELAPAMTMFGLALLDASTALSHMGADLLNVLLPALATLLQTIAIIVSGLVALHDALGLIGDTMLAMSVISVILISSLLKLISIFQTTIAVLDILAVSGGTANTVLELLDKNLKSIGVTLGTFTAGVMLLGAGLFILEQRFGAVTKTLSALSDAFLFIFGPLIDLVMWVGEASGATAQLEKHSKLLADALYALVGVSLTVVGAYLTLSAASSAVAGAQALVSTSSVSASASLSSLAATIYGTVIGAFRTLAITAVSAIKRITLALINSGWGVALFAAATALAFIADRWGVLEAIAVGVVGAITAALTSSGWGAALIAIAGALAWVAEKWGMLAAAAVAAIGAVAAALLGSGVGAIVISLGLLLAGLIVYWDEITAAVENFAGVVGSAIGGAIDWLTDFDARLQDVKNLLDALLNPEQSIGGLLNWLGGILDWIGEKIRQIQGWLSMIPGIGGSDTGQTGVQTQEVSDTRSRRRGSDGSTYNTNVTINMNGSRGEMSAREKYRIRKAIEDSPSGT